MPQVEVVFDIDVNGILDVAAKDRASGKSQSIRIEGSTGLSKDEIERLKKEAEIHVEEDRIKKELTELKNQADTLIYTAERTIKDFGDKINPADKTEIEEKITALRAQTEGQDTQPFKEAMEALSQTIQRIGAAMYQQKQQEQTQNQQEEKEGESEKTPESPEGEEHENK